MAFIHGRNTFISIDANDLSGFIKNSEFSREKDTHDTTTYGDDDKTYISGLGDSTFSMDGVYDDGATGPHDVLGPLRDAGTVVELIRRPEGTGTGLPEETVNVIVTSYVETNPVDDVVTWAAECQCTGAITDADQA